MKQYWKSALALAVAASVLQASVMAVSFPDLSGHWAQAELEHAVENGLLSGMPDGTLAPEGKLTRAQMAVILTRAFGAQEGGNLSGYVDVSAQAWYYDGLSKAHAMGLIQGTSSIHMSPDQEVTREQAMTILARAFCLQDGDVSYLTQFSDGASVNGWAQTSVAALAQSGYLTGMGDLRPTDPMTRAEFAQLMDRLVSVYYGEDRVNVEEYQEEVPETSAPAETSEVPETSTPAETSEVPETSTPAETSEVPETSTPAETSEVPEISAPAETSEVPETSTPAETSEETDAEASDGEADPSVAPDTEVVGMTILKGAKTEDHEDSEESSEAAADQEQTAQEKEEESAEVTEEAQPEQEDQEEEEIIPWQEPENKVIQGNVMVATPDQVLDGYTIQGDLIVAEGVGDGELVLKDTVVNGRLVLRAGTDVEGMVQLEGESSVETIVMAQEAQKTYFDIPKSCEVHQVQVVGSGREVWLKGDVEKLVLEAENLTFYGEELSVDTVNIVSVSSVNFDKDSEVDTLNIDLTARGAMVKNEGSIQEAWLIARDCSIIGEGTVAAATVMGRDCTIQDENCEITENIDTGLEQVNIQLTSNYDSLPVNQPLQITATFTGVDRERVCSVRWLKDGQPMQGFANDAFVLTEGKTSTLNWSITPYKEMPTSAQFSLEITYDGDTKRISKTIALENYSQEYYDKYDAQKILEKIQPAYIKVTTVRDTAIFENSNLTGQFASIPKGTVCQMINYFNSAGKANIIMPDGRSGWVAKWNISISNAKFTETGDYEDYEKEIFVNNMGYSSKTNYLVWINIRYQKVNVFVGSEGNWDLVRVAPCATGKSSTPTDLGVFEYYRRDAVWDFGTYYVKPALRFNGSEAMHSRPKRPNGSILEAYMGTPASHGCVRMLDEDIWWLSDNLPLWSTVVVY